MIAAGHIVERIKRSRSPCADEPRKTALHAPDMRLIVEKQRMLISAHMAMHAQNVFYQSKYPTLDIMGESIQDDSGALTLALLITRVVHVNGRTSPTSIIEPLPSARLLLGERYMLGAVYHVAQKLVSNAATPENYCVVVELTNLMLEEQDRPSTYGQVEVLKQIQLQNEVDLMTRLSLFKYVMQSPLNHFEVELERLRGQGVDDETAATLRGSFFFFFAGLLFDTGENTFERVNSRFDTHTIGVAIMNCATTCLQLVSTSKIAIYDDIAIVKFSLVVLNCAIANATVVRVRGTPYEELRANQTTTHPVRRMLSTHNLERAMSTLVVRAVA